MELKLVRVSPHDPADTAALHATLTASGKQSRYLARFENGDLTHITEERDAAAAEYSYKGARLVHYIEHGDPKNSARVVFDMQGRVASSDALRNGRAREVTLEEIAQIRERASLLRSHALSQRSVRQHSTH